MIKNNNGFGGKEVLAVSVICLILAAVLLTTSLKSSNHEKFKVLEYNARFFGSSATTYQMENSNDQIYMVELVDNEMFSKIENPFGDEKYCDVNESKVDYDQGKKYVTLRCGEYLIDHQDLSAQKFNIYKVSDWTLEKKDEDMQEFVSYNYKQDGQDGFNEIYSEKLFLYAFNKKMEKEYHSISEIPSEFGVYQKKLYRTKTLVDTVENKEAEKEEK